MNGGMIGARQRLQVLRPVVERVPVDVVDDVAARWATAGGFVDQASALTPDVWLSHLDPHSRGVGSVVSLSHALTTHGKGVVGRHALCELCSDTSTLPTVDAVQGVVGRSGAPNRAVVGCSNLGGLPSERGMTDGASEGDRHTPTLPFAGTGTTPIVASLHNRTGIGFDLDPRNAELVAPRTDEVKRALFGTTPELPGQEALFA